MDCLGENASVIITTRYYKTNERIKSENINVKHVMRSY